MKRRIQVSTPSLKITATIDTFALTRDEVESVRDSLADDLMRVASTLKWCGAPLNKVKVK